MAKPSKVFTTKTARNCECLGMEVKTTRRTQGCIGKMLRAQFRVCSRCQAWVFPGLEGEKLWRQPETAFPCVLKWKWDSCCPSWNPFHAGQSSSFLCGRFLASCILCNLERRCPGSAYRNGATLADVFFQPVFSPARSGRALQPTRRVTSGVTCLPRSELPEVCGCISPYHIVFIRFPVVRDIVPGLGGKPEPYTERKDRGMA